MWEYLTRFIRRPVLAAAAFLFVVMPTSLLAQPAGGPPGLNQLDLPAHGVVVNYPDTWRNASGQHRDLWHLKSNELAWPETDNPTSAATIRIYVESHKNHPQAVDRLKQIEAEWDDEVSYENIGGWVSLHRRNYQEIKHPGPPGDPGTGRENVLVVTTAIAAGNKVIRMEGILEPGVAEDFADVVQDVTRGAVFSNRGASGRAQQDIDSLENRPSLRGRRSNTTANPNSDDAPGAFEDSAESGSGDGPGNPGLTLRVNNAGGADAEIEMIASTDGSTVIVANNSRNFATSTDGGVTYGLVGSAPIGPTGTANGDPSLAYGASGSFYLAYIRYPGGAAGTTCSTGITRSDNNGTSFNFVGDATMCDDTLAVGMGNNMDGACFPDQEHIAADRFNVSATGQDQVYSAWRDFATGGCGRTNGIPIAGGEIPSIVCSTDSGVNWTNKVATNGSGSYSRITVGQDGNVYVVFNQGSNVMLQKFSSCQSGLATIGGAVMIANVSQVTCNAPTPGAVPGLDRCNNGSNLSSHMVAVDDTDANHIYAAYAENTTPGLNENVIIRDSIDGGATWPASRVVQVSGGPVARRFMPWVCSTGGAAYTSWYDTRLAVSGAAPGSGLPNDLADFYGASAFRNSDGDLVPGGEFRISEVADPLCASGWPSRPRSPWDSETCGVQPQLAGTCFDNSATPVSTGVRCDFSNCAVVNNGETTGACECGAATDTCNTGGGGPKYGDYNGNACAAGRFFASWASATSPPAISPASTDVDVFSFTKIVCCTPQIQVPAPVSFGDVCEGSTLTETMEVCNTGKEDLRIDSILSSDDQFTPIVPSAGFPVIISPDACFPFEVEFVPDGLGAQSADITIVTNDAVNPVVTVIAAGTVGEADLNVAIADSGNFGGGLLRRLHRLGSGANQPRLVRLDNFEYLGRRS
jgi:hypothetical protein